jgi:hypothetical protein
MTCVCEQCGHRWESRGNMEDANLRPSRCPQCMTTAWDRAKRKAGRPRKKAPDQPGLALEEPATAAPARPPTMCPHNRPVGAHCWQCRGIAAGN